MLKQERAQRMIRYVASHTKQTDIGARSHNQNCYITRTLAKNLLSILFLEHEWEDNEEETC